MGSSYKYPSGSISPYQARNQATEFSAHFDYPIEAINPLFSPYNTAGAEQMSISYSGDSYGSGYGSQASYTQDMSRSSSYIEDSAGSPLTQYSDTMSPTETAYGVGMGSIQPASDIDTRFYDFIQLEDPNPSYYKLKSGYEPNEDLPYTVLCNQR